MYVKRWQYNKSKLENYSSNFLIVNLIYVTEKTSRVNIINFKWKNIHTSVNQSRRKMSERKMREFSTHDFLVVIWGKSLFSVVCSKHDDDDVVGIQIGSIPTSEKKKQAKQVEILSVERWDNKIKYFHFHCFNSTFRESVSRLSTHVSDGRCNIGSQMSCCLSSLMWNWISHLIYHNSYICNLDYNETWNSTCRSISLR